MTAKKKAAETPAFDPTKMFGEFDPNKVMGEFSKAFSEMKFPGLDGNALVESQRKNIEALTQANKIAFEGMQAVFQRQAEIMNTAMEEMQTVFGELSNVKEPQANLSAQTDLVKGAVEKTIANMKELAEMAGKSNTEAFETIHSRFTESLNEVKAEVMKLKT